MFLATGCAAQLRCKQHKVVYIVSKHLGKDAHAIGSLGAGLGSW